MKQEIYNAETWWNNAKVSGRNNIVTNGSYVFKGNPKIDKFYEFQDAKTKELINKEFMHQESVDPSGQSLDLMHLKNGGAIPERYKKLGFSRVGQKLKSTNPNKKWMVLAKQGEHYKIVHGGQKGMQDFSQHHDKQRQKKFWQRMGGYDSERAKNSFSPLYWHKKFGTWEEGGEIYSELEEKHKLSEGDQLYKQGTIKVAWIGENPDILESKMYNDIEVALEESKDKQYLVFELDYSDDDYYRWKLLPYGMYNAYQVAAALNTDVPQKNTMEKNISQSQIEEGKKVELEHASTIEAIKNNPDISVEKAAEMIAKDHLSESPDYYKKLKTMEQSFSDGGKVKLKDAGFLLQPSDNAIYLGTNPQGIFSYYYSPNGSFISTYKGSIEKGQGFLSYPVKKTFFKEHEIIERAKPLMKDKFDDGGNIQHNENKKDMKEFYMLLHDAQADLLGPKKLGTGTKVTDNKTHVVSEIIDVMDGAFLIQPIKSFAVRDTKAFEVSFEEFQHQFKRGAIDIEGFEHTKSDETLLHFLLKDYMHVQMVQRMKEGAQVDRVFRTGEEVIDFESGREYIVVNPVSKSQAKYTHPVLDAVDEKGNEVILATELLKHPDSPKSERLPTIAKISDSASKYAGKIVRIVRDLGSMVEIKFYSFVDGHFIGDIVPKSDLNFEYKEGGELTKGKLNHILDEAYEQYRLGGSKMEFEQWLIDNQVGRTFFSKIKKLKEGGKMYKEGERIDILLDSRDVKEDGEFYYENETFFYEPNDPDKRVKSSSNYRMFSDYIDTDSKRVQDAVETQVFNKMKEGGKINQEQALQKALSALKDFGANIEKLQSGKYSVEDNGIWGFLEEENDMILDADEIIDLANKYTDVKIEYREGGTMQFEPGATTREVNDLIQYIQDSDELTERKNKIYQNAYESGWDKTMLSHVFKNAFSYKAEKEFRKEPMNENIHLTSKQRDELGKLLADEFTLWKIDNDIELAEGGEVEAMWINMYDTLGEAEGAAKFLSEKLSKIYKVVPSTYEPGKWDLLVQPSKMNGGGKISQDVIERFITEYNLHGINARVMFKGDPSTYYTKNISPDRKTIFVVDMLGNVRNKKIVDIIRVDNKKVSIDDITMLEDIKCEGGSMATGGGVENNYEIKLTENSSLPKRGWKGVVSEEMYNHLEEIKNQGGFLRYNIDIYDDKSKEPIDKKNIKGLYVFLQDIGVKYSDGGSMAEGGRMSEEKEVVPSMIDAMKQNMVIYMERLSDEKLPEPTRRVLNERLAQLKKIVSNYEAFRASKLPKPEPVVEAPRVIAVTEEPLLEEPTQIRTPEGTVPSMKDAIMPVEISVTPADANQYYIILDENTRQKVKDALYYRKVKYSSIVLPDRRTKLIIVGSNNLDTAYAFYEKFKQKKNEEVLPKESITGIHLKPGSAKARMIMSEPSTASTMANGGRFRMCPIGTEIQTLILSKDQFQNQLKARKWLSDHGFKHEKVDEKENTLRYRQQPPSKFDSNSFRTINITKGVAAVIACPVTSVKERGKKIKKKAIKKNVKMRMREGSKIPTIKELKQLFDKVNADIIKEGTGESVVALTDSEYYSIQIQNIYELNEKKADALAKKLAKAEKNDMKKRLKKSAKQRMKANA